MPHLFRTRDGKVYKASQPVFVALADGTKVEGHWGGSATEEKLDWWLRKPDHELGQTEEAAEVAVRDEHTKEPIWGAAPPGARVFFVLEEPKVGKDGRPYRLARLVTTAVTPEQEAYFHDTRFSLFGTLNPDGTITRIPPVTPPPPPPPAQGELF